MSQSKHCHDRLNIVRISEVVPTVANPHTTEKDA